MAFVPIASPESFDTSSLFEASPDTSYIKGLYEEARNVIHTNPVSDLNAAMERATLNGKGKFLSPKEIKEKYPEAYVKYSKSGGYEAQVAFDNNRISETNYRNALVNNMPDTFLAKASKFAGGLIGMALSPTTLIAGAVSGGVGSLAEESALGIDTVSELVNSSKIAKAMLKAPIGAIKGGAVMLPQTFGEDVYRKYTGEKDVDLGEDLSNAFLQGAVAGATLDTVFGKVHVIDKDSINTSLEVAKRQIESGQKININPLLSDGTYKAWKNLEKITPDKIDNGISDLYKKLKPLIDKRDEINKDIDIFKNEIRDDTHYDKAILSKSYKDYVNNLSDDETKLSKDDFNKARKLNRSLKKYESNINELKDKVRNTIEYKKFLENKPEPLANTDLKATSSIIDTPENDILFNKEEYDKRQEEIEDMPGDIDEVINKSDVDKYVTSMEPEIDDALSKIDLTNEMKDIINNADIEDIKHDKLSKALKNYEVCRRGE